MYEDASFALNFQLQSTSRPIDSPVGSRHYESPDHIEDCGDLIEYGIIAFSCQRFHFGHDIMLETIPFIRSHGF